VVLRTTLAHSSTSVEIFSSGTSTLATKITVAMGQDP
jgi:hypothetical protein